MAVVNPSLQCDGKRASLPQRALNREPSPCTVLGRCVFQRQPSPVPEAMLLFLSTR